MFSYFMTLVSYLHFMFYRYSVSWSACMYLGGLGSFYDLWIYISLEIESRERTSDGSDLSLTIAE